MNSNNNKVYNPFDIPDYNTHESDTNKAREFILPDISANVGGVIGEVKKAHPKYNPKEYLAKTRTGIAKGFLWGYFILFILVFIFVWVYNNNMLNNIITISKYPGYQDVINNIKLLDIKNVLIVVTSALGTPLGFVIGYYFKSEQDRDRQIQTQVF